MCFCAKGGERGREMAGVDGGGNRCRGKRLREVSEYLGVR